MINESFYVHVVSTDSLNTYPDNQGSRFTNTLPTDITFADVTKYECSLAEISYNSNFNNISDDCAFALFDFFYLYSDTNEYGKLYNIQIPPGNYQSAQVVCDFLNSLVDDLNISRLKNKKLFSYNTYTRKFDLNVDGLYLTILVKGSLIDILGLERRQALPNQIGFIGKSKAKEYYYYPENPKPKEVPEKRYFKNRRQSWDSDSVHGGTSPFVAQMTCVSAFLVYVDFIKDVIYGSKFSNVIRTVAIRGGNNGERIVDSFIKRIYVPIKFNQFNSINVEIRDFQSRPLEFLSGNVSCTFHIRPKSSSV